MAVNTDKRADSADEGGVESEPEARVGLSYTLSQLRKDTTARIGMAIVGFMTLVALIAFVDGVVLNYFGMQYALAEAVWISPIKDSPDFLRPRST